MGGIPFSLFIFYFFAEENKQQYQAWPPCFFRETCVIWAIVAFRPVVYVEIC